MKYAAKTTVSCDKSKQEIEIILRKYKADRFGYGCDPCGATIGFSLNGKMFRFRLPLPDINSKEFKWTANRRLTSNKQAVARWEQVCRQRWRALCLVIKAKLEAVESGISTLEEEFLANIVMPDGRTVGGSVMPEIEDAYKTGNMSSRLLTWEG